MKYNLFLDDFRDLEDGFYITRNPIYRLNNWIIVRSYKEFIEYIKDHGLPEIVSFDHDLADEHYNNHYVIPYDDYQEKTGYDCAKWLCEYCMDNKLEFPMYYVHSMNDIGKINIVKYIENFKKHYNN